MLMIVNHQLESLTEMDPCSSSSINVTEHIPFKLPYNQMDSQEKDHLILKLYQEIGHLKRVIHALETERDHLFQALPSSRARVDSPTDDDLPHSYDDDQYEEDLVSDDTLRGYESGESGSTESDSNSIFFPQRCGTPCSAPPNFHSISDEVPESSKSFQRKRHSSLPSTRKLPKISLGNYDQGFSAEDAGSLSVTLFKEQYDVQFPQVGDDYVETPSSLWCTERRNSFRCQRLRPRQRYELNDVYRSFSALWHDLGSESAYPIQQSASHQVRHSDTDEISSRALDIPDIPPQEDIHLDACTSVSRVEAEIDEPDPQMLYATGYMFDTTNDINENSNDDAKRLLEVINASVPINQPSFVTPADYLSHLNASTWTFLPVTPRNKYMRRTFNPSLPCIPEYGEYVMQATDLELHLSSARPTKTTSAIVTSQIFTRHDDTLRSKEKKSWFDMVMEDEEYD